MDDYSGQLPERTHPDQFQEDKHVDLGIALGEAICAALDAGVPAEDVVRFALHTVDAWREDSACELIETAF